MTQREAVLEAKVEVVEVPLTWDMEDGLAVTCRVDVAERGANGALCIGDHKTVAGWGPSDEQEAALSIQRYVECLLWWKCRGEVPSFFYFTVLKKTKTPEVFRHFLPGPTAEELTAFEDQLRAYAALMRHHREVNRPVRHVHRDCGWCSFAPLCWSVDNAREMFKVREDRRPKEQEPEEEIDE